MEVTMKEAEALAPVSKSTLYNDRKSGKLSVKKNSKGRTVIDIAELQRVYGDLSKVPENSNETVLEKSSITPKGISPNENPLENPIVKNHIELIEIERRREREQFLDQIDRLDKSLEKAQEGQNKLTALLEDKSGDRAGDWEKSMRALEARIANQEKAAKEQQEREDKMQRQNRALKKALDAEKNKSFFQKLFG